MRPLTKVEVAEFTEVVGFAIDVFDVVTGSSSIQKR